jgi:valyl-tRNA synthetase
MHPFVPFITEEIFQKLKEKFPKLKIKSDLDPYTKDLTEALLSSGCIVAPFPKIIDQFSDSIEEEFEFINKILYTIRNIRGEMQLPPQSACDIIFSSKTSLTNLERVKKNQHIISALIKTKEILFVSNAPADLDFFASSQAEEVEIIIPLPNELREKEKARLASQIQKLEQQISDLKNKLSNEEFLAKAPKPLIEKFQKNLEDNQNLFNEMEKKLKQL